MKTILITLGFISFSCIIFSQDAFIYTPNGKMNLKYSLDKVLITHTKGLNKSDINNSKKYLAINQISDSVSDFYDNSVSFSIASLSKEKFSNKKELIEYINNFNNDTSIAIWPFLETPFGYQIGIRNKINIMLKEATKIESTPKTMFLVIRSIYSFIYC